MARNRVDPCIAVGLLLFSLLLSACSSSSELYPPAPSVVDYYQPSTYYPKIVVTNDSGQTWTTVYTGTTNFNSISCPSVSTCLAVGTRPSLSPDLLVTTNNGQSWESRPFKLRTNGDLDISCYDESNCYMIPGSGGGTFLVTSNAGKSWQEQPAFRLQEFIRSIICPAPKTCFATGSDDMILATTDGQTWEQQQSVTGGGLPQPSCPTPTNCYIASSGGFRSEFKNRAMLEVTSDGKKWQLKLLPPEIKSARSISCPAVNICFLLGDDNIYFSKDGGDTWQKQQTFQQVGLGIIRCGSTQTCVAVGYKGIAATTDGGQTWNYEEPTSLGKNQRGLIDLACPNDKTCYAVGY